MYFLGGKCRISFVFCALFVLLSATLVLGFPLQTQDADLLDYWHTPEYPDIDDPVTIWANTTEAKASSLNFTFEVVNDSGTAIGNSFTMADQGNGLFSIPVNNFVPDKEAYLRYKIILENETGGALYEFPASGWLDNITWDGTVPTTGLSVQYGNVFGGNLYARNITEFTLDATDPDTDGSGYYEPSGVNYTQYSINGSAANYSSPFTTNVSDGSYVMQYYSADNAGNAEAAQNVTFTVDNTFPSVTIESPVNMVYNVQNMDFNVTLNETGYNCTYDLNGTNYTMVNESSSRWTANRNVPDGNYTAVFHCWDLALNMRTNSTPFQVDATPPEVILYSPENRTYNTTSLTLNYSVSDAKGDLSAVWYEYNGSNHIINGSVGTGSLSGSMTLTALDNQVSTLIFRANDTAGNTNSTEVTFTVDTTDPVAEIISPVDGFNWSLFSVPTFEANFSDNLGLDTIIVQFNSSLTNWTWLPVMNMSANGSKVLNISNTPQNASQIPSEGDWWWRAWCNDTANNTNISQVRKFTVDLTKPSVSVTSPIEGYNYSNQTLWLNWSASDLHLDSVWYYNGTDNVSLSGNITFTAPDDQESTVIVYANDSAGNTGSESVTFLVDTTNPTVSSSWSRNSTTVHISVSHFDINPGKIVLNWDGQNSTYNWTSGSNTTELSKSVSLPDPGNCHTHNYYVYVNDSAGNWNQTNTTEVKICISKPPKGNSGWSSSGGGGFSASCEENWTCTNWSACIDGMHTRVCNDTNNCGTDLNRPSETLGCSVSQSEDEQETVLCEPGEKMCVGDNVQECTQDGTAWEFVENCKYGCYGGECNPEIGKQSPEVTGMVSGSTAALIGSVIGGLAIAGGLAWYLRKRRMRALMGGDQ